VPAHHLRRAFQWDVARQIERMDYLIRWLPYYQEWGYEEVFLNIEDAFDFPSVPGVGRHRAYRPAEMERFTREASQRGIRIIPFVPLWGHTQYLVKVPRLRRLNELRDSQGRPLASGQICPLHEDTLKLATKLLADVSPYCTSGILFVGLDESFDLGKCPRCRADIRRKGLARHFAGYVRDLAGICASLGHRIGIAADMLYYIREAIPLLPKETVAFDWFYYPFRRMPRIELYNFADVDLTGEMRAAGLDVYGLPTNGILMNELLPPFLDRLRNIVSWWDYLHRKQAQAMLITSFAPTRSPIELSTVVDAAAATLWLNPGERDLHRMLERGFERVYGKGAGRHAALAARIEKYQHAGYFRHQGYRQWPPMATLLPPGPAQTEEVFFRRLLARATDQAAPRTLCRSLRIRHYFAAKDRFVAEGSRLLAGARQAVAGGKSGAVTPFLRQLAERTTNLERSGRRAMEATRALWRTARYRDDPDSNERTIQDDLRRIRQFRIFLHKAGRHPSRVLESNPLMAGWHAMVWVRNFAPALQGIAMEVRNPNGEWKVVHTLFSLEFTAKAGVPRTDFRRRHSVPLDWKGDGPLRLRLSVRGIGQLELYDWVVTNGVRVLHPVMVREGGECIRNREGLFRTSRPGAVMGMPPPRRGFPSIDWSDNQAWVEAEFRPGYSRRRASAK
jgi:hypothetical protein